MTLSDLAASGSLIISMMPEGTICQDTPYLSLSQPHSTSSPPSVSFSHSSSISFCVSQFTNNDMAGANGNAGPPFNATNGCPSSSNATVITESFGLPDDFDAASP